MPWKETSPMEERIRFVVLARERKTPMSVLCNLFGISREAGYKWLNRYELLGAAGLKEHSRRPHGNSKATPQEVIDAAIALRREYPLWGPKKLAIILKERLPNAQIPAASTIGDIIERNGLIKKRLRPRRTLKSIKPNISVVASNDLWCTDFKGNFLVGDGNRCHPLTITDSFSRFLLGCESLISEAIIPTQKIFEEIFQRYGLPRAILSDNGGPFSSRSPGGLTRLSAWWVKLGITPIHIQPGHPEQNGSHERMHRTLKAATARPPAKTLKDQQEAFERFKIEYNTIRPHEALGQKRPAEFYEPSLKSFPSKLKEPAYPADFEVRKIRQNGEIKWKGKTIFLTETLVHEPVGLEEIGEGLRLIYFCHLPIAMLDEGSKKIILLPSPLRNYTLSAMSPV